MAKSILKITVALTGDKMNESLVLKKRNLNQMLRYQLFPVAVTL